MLGCTGFSGEDRTFDAVGVMRSVESHGLATRLALAVPTPLLRVARPVIPTLIFLARPR
jgi:hypothetical protein